MTTLIVGLAIFFGAHLLPSLTPVRAGLASSLGENRYKGVFTLISVVGLVLIVYGYSQAPFIHQFAPWKGGKHMAMTFMPIVFFLLAAANMPTHTRRILKHPFLLGIAIWSAVHLSANGDMRSNLLFGSFLAYSFIAWGSLVLRGKDSIDERPAQGKYDAMAFGGGLIVYAVILPLHGWLFGVPVMQF